MHVCMSIQGLQSIHYAIYMYKSLFICQFTMDELYLVDTWLLNRLGRLHLIIIANIYMYFFCITTVQSSVMINYILIQIMCCD